MEEVCGRRHEWSGRAERLLNIMGSSSLSARATALAKLCGLSDERTTVVANLPEVAYQGLVFRDLELRVPHASWSPWLALLLKFPETDDGLSTLKSDRRNVFPVPPVCLVRSRHTESAAGLRTLTAHLEDRGEVATMTTKFGPPRATVYFLPRSRVLRLLRKMPRPPPDAKLPPLTTPEGLLWAIVVPQEETSEAMDDRLAELFFAAGPKASLHAYWHHLDPAILDSQMMATTPS